MKIDASGKVWATWREWARMGREDALKGVEPRYTKNPDYMETYREVKQNKN